MNALLKTMRRVANDWRGPPKPRILSVVTLGRPPRSLAAIALAVLVALLLVAACGSIWFAHEMSGAAGLLAPTMQADVQSITPKTDSAAVHRLPSAPVAPTALPAPAAPADIQLPASQLDAAARDDDDPAITIVAARLADLPVLRDPTHAAITIAPASAAPDGDRTVDGLLNQAQADLRSGDSESAYALYEEVLALAPANHDALAAEGYLLAKSGDYRGAAAIDRRLLRQYPRDAAARRNLIAALSQSAAPEAADELDTMAAATPGDAAVQAALAHKLMQDGENEEALPYLDRAVRAAPADIAYRLALAGLYDKLNYRVQALALYRDVLRAAADPDTPARLPVSLSSVQQRAAWLAMQLGMGTGGQSN